MQVEKKGRKTTGWSQGRKRVDLEGSGESVHSEEKGQTTNGKQVQRAWLGSGWQ